MKKFEAPMLEVVYYEKEDIITKSGCECDECLACPEGSNDCEYYDFCQTHCARDGGNPQLGNVAGPTINLMGF